MKFDLRKKIEMTWQSFIVKPKHAVAGVKRLMSLGTRKLRAIIGRLAATAGRWMRKKESFVIELIGLVFGLITFLAALYLYSRGLIDLPTFLSAIFGVLLVAFAFYFYLIRRREQTLLISFAAKYLLERDESKFDKLLGVLIAGEWEKMKMDPVEEFFKSVRTIAQKGDVEMRRRVAEALPALFKLDLEHGEEIAEILRTDWDEIEWKSDNRRRTIEALSSIILRDRKFAKKHLRIFDRDEVFTLIAIIEVLDIWRREVSRKEAEKLYQELMGEVGKRSYSTNEKQTLSELWVLLDMLHSDGEGAAQRFEQLKYVANTYLQICLARNLRYLCREFPRCRAKKICNGSPEKILGLMEFFLNEDKDRNVRRPIAKEDSLECLLILLQYREWSKKAQELLWKLLNDRDDIIRLTTFDRIENILDVDADFGSQVLQHVATSNHNPKMVQRANSLLKEK